MFRIAESLDDRLGWLGDSLYLLPDDRFHPSIRGRLLPRLDHANADHVARLQTLGRCDAIRHRWAAYAGLQMS